MISRLFLFKYCNKYNVLKISNYRFIEGCCGVKDGTAVGQGDSDQEYRAAGSKALTRPVIIKEATPPAFVELSRKL